MVRLSYLLKVQLTKVEIAKVKPAYKTKAAAYWTIITNSQPSRTQTLLSLKRSSIEFLMKTWHPRIGTEDAWGFKKSRKLTIIRTQSCHWVSWLNKSKETWKLSPQLSPIEDHWQLKDDPNNSVAAQHSWVTVMFIWMNPLTSKKEEETSPLISTVQVATTLSKLDSKQIQALNRTCKQIVI